MKVIGLTGPTGSGKSTLARLAKTKGFEVVDCDKEARMATEKGSLGLQALIKVFGDDVLLSDGSLDRKKLAEKAFKTQENIEILNKTLLPFILEIIKQRINEFEMAGYSKVLLDAPTLYESGADALCDEVLVVLCDGETRKKRIIARDSLTETQADIRLKASKPDKFYLDKTKHIIYNTDDSEQFLIDSAVVLDRLSK